MRKTFALLLVAFCLTATAQNSSTFAPKSQIYITHTTVIDTDTGKEAPDQTVVVADGKIADVAKSKNRAAPTSARIVDGRGKYLIPGLWDMHVHGTRFDGTLPLYIANGVTGVREMFGPPDANKFRAELSAKHLIAPHIYLASPIVDGKPPIVPNSIEVATADEARRAVDEQKQRGADFIKVYSLLSRDAYFVIIDEARRQNIPVDGHVPNSVSVWEATAAKQRTIEHLFGVELGCSSREKDLRPKFLTANPFKNEWDALLLEAWQSYSDERCKSLFAELKKNGTWPVPTLAVRHSFGLLNDPQFTSDNRVRYFSGEFRDWVTGKLDARMKESSAADFQVIRKTFSAESRVTGELFRAGVPMLAGTDVGNPFCFPGFSLHDELALLVESGLTPLAALQAATRNAAIFMNASDRYGAVAKGKIADLVLLDADPLQDIRNTTKIREVFLAGKEFDRAALDSILRRAEAAANHATNTAEESQTSEEAQGLKMPGPDVQNLMLGSWVINVKYPSSSEKPSGDTGVGTEVWRAGPGGRSVIEASREKNAKGEIEGLGVVWWDKQAQGQRFVWCENSNPDGCYVSKEVAKWNGDRLEWKEEQETSGKKRVYSEVFRDITPDSFMQILQEGDTGGPLKETAIISAKRISQPSISSGSHDDDLRERQESLTKANAEIQKLSDLLAGRWSGILTTEAASHERGRADETWRLSPGGLTLVEKNRLSTPNGDSFDYAAVWWNPKAQKYQGIWCADINDEGCNGFDATLKGKQVEMTGEWEQKGHRRAWREVFSRPDADSSIQTLDIGEPGGELKRVSAIRATKTTEGSTELSKAPADDVKGCGPESKLKPQTGSQISPSPEMRKILATQLGTWSQHEERPDGTTGDGEATWRPGPGGMSLVENEFIRNSTGELSGLSVTWYDQDAHGYRALWCSNKTKNGCLVMSKLAHWEGDQFVLRDEFESNGKKLAYKEVESGITPTTYTLTSYIGEPGGDLKPTSTTHATKISDENVKPSDVPAEAELRAFMAELRKASIEGDVDTIANLMTDDYVQTDINGYRQDKTKWLNEYFRPLANVIKAGKFHWDEYERKNLEFHFYGDCAVVTGELQAKGTGAKFGPQHTWVADPNSTFSGTLHFTHVYIKRNGKWMLAALHNQMPLPPTNAAK